MAVFVPVSNSASLTRMRFLFRSSFMEIESPDNPASNAMTTNEPVPGEEYETLYIRLQQIVEQLETGDLPLARALALYEEGVATAEACQRLLDQAALRVRTLMGDQSPAAAEADV